jgi:flagellar hook assembly protein FlgD
MTDFGETGVAEMPKTVNPLSGILLHQNTPNPFTEETAISYQLGIAADVRLQIYNIAGQLVKTLVDAYHEPGQYNVVWSGMDERGRQVSNGVYFCCMDADDQNIIRKMTIVR